MNSTDDERAQMQIWKRTLTMCNGRKTALMFTNRTRRITIFETRRIGRINTLTQGVVCKFCREMPTHRREKLLTLHGD